MAIYCPHKKLILLIERRLMPFIVLIVLTRGQTPCEEAPCEDIVLYRDYWQKG